MASSSRALQRLAADSAGLANRLVMRPVGTGGRTLGSWPLDRAITGRVTLVTGASSGIGEATARAIGAAGGTVALAARTQSKLEDVAAAVEAAGGHASVHPVDLADLEAIDALASDALARHGHIDILVNNAGRSIRRSVANSTTRFHDYERTMQLNYFAAVRLTLGLLPAMQERRHGHIINVSTLGVLTRVPRFSAYVASKAALDAFGDSLQAEVLGEDIRVTTIHMPLVRTPMIAPTGAYRGVPAISADEAAGYLTRAIVERPRRLTPPVGQAMNVADVFAPGVTDWLRHRGFASSRDSRAARGDD
ncbi:SDR family NAD(P)-dependent oxidoreductase [Paraconexibacter antarcticus]|uniref:SDR family NAD(P)-dependent oxidoreductase n=1 Tax=Paraconexibacter antarcticus TaxID=2949664 RepID=A0ABY5DX20_9ACTN|nr:SDR family NAD(P)-dependent oxidoreductase [Paraconexibacter antarcticus]UTI65489.1 SDR family NAD(P)-dependent oxidoreductase [Paraconexibacter antarcticus]